MKKKGRKRVRERRGMEGGREGIRSSPGIILNTNGGDFPPSEKATGRRIGGAGE